MLRQTVKTSFMMPKPIRCVASKNLFFTTVAKNKIFFKVTNRSENHYNFQYRDGLNILQQQFNNNLNDSCGPGGFYFTTREHIHNFYRYGCNLRVVELPMGSPDFQMLQIPMENKYRANQIILKEKYPLSDINTYHKFGIKIPTLSHAVKQDYFPVIKYLVKNNLDIDIIDNFKMGGNYRNNLLMDKIYLRGDTDIGIFLSKHVDYSGDSVHSVLDVAISYNAARIARNVYYGNKEAFATFDFNEHLTKRASYGTVQIIKFLIEAGADVNHNRGIVLYCAAKHGNWNNVKFLLDNGADIKSSIYDIVGIAKFEGHGRVVKILKEHIQKLNKN